MKTVEISESAFADDLVVLALRERNLQEKLNVWETALKKELKKVMTMRKDLEKIKIYINEKMVEQVEILKYLRIGIHEKVKRK